MPQHPRRPYLQRRRAERSGETRARILDALIALHEEVGPSRTTVSAIAARAGVQRLTVYRHFPDDRGRLEASTARWLSAHPPPAPALWSKERDPATATESALVGLFAYYRRTARMWTTAYRDVGQVPGLGPAMARFEDHLTAIGDGLVDAWSREVSSPEARALIHHALRFSTWESLAREGLDDEQMARLIVDWLTNLAAGRRSGAV
jgi:AcrR family transcriptional regulator